MKRLISCAFVVLALCDSPISSANDSTARVGVGGLEFVKTENIEMVSEVLEISALNIKVTYRFLNTSSQDIKTAVAFPMPAFDLMGIVGSGGKSSPLESFRNFVDGQPVSVKKRRVYLINNVDVSDKLRKIGLSEEQIFDPNFRCTDYAGDSDILPDCTLTKEQVAAISKQKLLGGAIQETAYWEQVFPAGKEIEVVHQYKPYVGHGANHGTTFNDYRDAKLKFADACLDDGAFRILRRGAPDADWASGRDDAFLYYLDIEYILGTGRNWKGPIKDFKLILKKRAPEDVVSLCFPGHPKKTSPITIEFSQTNFVPQDKLVVYFFERHSEATGSNYPR
jgi:hypothetical protein